MENEIHATVKAADSGISPPVFLYGHFDNIGYIVMQKLHKTLGDIYPYNVEYIIQAIDLYISLWEKNKIRQRDLKCNNIMINEKGRLFLIDYGVSKNTNEPLNLKDDNHSHHIYVQCNLLLNTLFFKGPYEYGTGQAFDDDQNCIRKLYILLNCIYKVNQHLGKKYQVNKEVYASYSRFDFKTMTKLYLNKYHKEYFLNLGSKHKEKLMESLVDTIFHLQDMKTQVNEKSIFNTLNHSLEESKKKIVLSPNLIL